MSRVDVIIGGPPCQTFSLAGPARSGSEEMREALKNDPRNTLYKHYLDIVRQLKPDMLVFENVEGILSKQAEVDELNSKQSLVIELICDEIESMGYSTQIENNIVDRYQILNAADFGVSQYRKRIIIIANRHDVINSIPKKTHGPGRLPYHTVKDAIGDLPVVLPEITAGRMKTLKNIDIVTNNFSKCLEAFENSLKHLKYLYKDRPEIANEKFEHLIDYVRLSVEKLKKQKFEKLEGLTNFLKGYSERLNGLQESKNIEPKMTLHRSRAHNFRDLIIFILMKQKSSSARFMNSDNEDYDDFLEELYPYNRSKHTDTYVKHSWDNPSNTILAHMEKDGLKFIHPVQPRTFTPYEAALLQSFPRDYEFAGLQNAQYRQIGNAVPPLMAKAIGDAVLKTLTACKRDIEELDKNVLSVR